MLGMDNNTPAKPAPDGHSAYACRCRAFRGVMEKNILAIPRVGTDVLAWDSVTQRWTRSHGLSRRAQARWVRVAERAWDAEHYELTEGIYAEYYEQRRCWVSTNG